VYPRVGKRESETKNEERPASEGGPYR